MSMTRKSLLRSPVNSTSPDVAVTPATSGVGHWLRQRTLPVAASIACSQPLA
jgi:hypothetical protein